MLGKTMSKIVQAVNAMISNPQSVTSIIPGSEDRDELFFSYKNKHNWSIGSRDGDLFLWFYPGDQKIEHLAKRAGDWGAIPIVIYNASEIGTKEAKQSFSELYGLLKERLYGVDIVLNEIISDF
jgi:hypothetical protein